MKPTWAASWQWAPYLDPQEATEAVGPSIGDARFKYDFGYAIREGHAAFSYYLPTALNGWYVAIWAHDPWGDALLWVGVIKTDGVEMYGSTGFPSGGQEMTAYELGQILERDDITGSVTESILVTGDGRVDRSITFNRRPGFGLSRVGNKKTAFGLAAPVFGDTGDFWTNKDILYYLLAYYSPSQFTWYVAGAIDELDKITDEYDLEGLNLWQALDQIIDRRRGLAYRILTWGEGPLILYVFSVLSYPVSFGDVALSANQNRAILNFDAAIDLTPKLRFNDLDNYSAVTVRGGPIRSCFTLSFADETLEEGWESQEVIDYLEALGAGATAEENDKQRSRDEFARVFQFFRPPLNWDWQAGDGEGGTKQNAAPSLFADGSLDADTKSETYTADKIFERHLPFELPGGAANQPVEYRAMFALVQDDADDFVYVDRLNEVDKTPAQVRPADQEFGIYIEARPNHVLALNHWLGAKESATEPEVDYETLVMTVCAALDKHLQVTAQIPGNTIGRDSAGTKLIPVENLELWYVVPGTVEEVDDGALVKHDGGIVRDDTQFLKQIAAFALAWYGQARATLEYTYQGISVQLPCGVLVLGVASTWHLTEVGSVVTERKWDFRANEGAGATIYKTGFDELNFEKMIDSEPPNV